MSKNTLAAGTSPFAHLLGGLAVLGARVTGRRAEEDPKDPDAEEDPKDPDAEEDPKDPDAEEDPKDPDAEVDESDERAEDDGDDEDMAKARREGFAAAQARGRKIFSAASAGLRPDMAAHLAFNETSPSSAAIAMLDMAASGGAPVVHGSRLGRRMARVVIPNPGSPAGEGAGRAKSEVSDFAALAKRVSDKLGR